MQPRLVHAVSDPATATKDEWTPVVQEAVTLSNPYHFDTVIHALTDVVHGARGTARRSGSGAKYRFAGKTGTAQVIGIPQGGRYDERRIAKRFRDHSLFIAFAPVDKPKIAIAVIAENGGGGSRTAAPIARKVMDYFLIGPPDQSGNKQTGKKQKGGRSGAAG